MKVATLKLSDELHKELKIQVTKEDTTIQDYVVDLIKKSLEEKNK